MSADVPGIRSGFLGDDVSRKRKKRWMLGLMVSQVGFVIVGSILFGAWLDDVFDTGPFLAVTGLIIGFGSAISLLVRINKMQRSGEL